MYGLLFFSVLFMLLCSAWLNQKNQAPVYYFFKHGSSSLSFGT